MDIRPAHVTDAASIESSYGHYVKHSVLAVDVDNPPTARNWEQHLEHLAASGFPTVVAVEDRDVVGYALLTPWLAKPAFAHTTESSIYLAPHAVGACLGPPTSISYNLLCSLSVQSLPVLRQTPRRGQLLALTQHQE